jgi:hypothetical protein
MALRGEKLALNSLSQGTACHQEVPKTCMFIVQLLLPPADKTDLEYIQEYNRYGLCSNKK